MGLIGTTVIRSTALAFQLTEIIFPDSAFETPQSWVRTVQPLVVFVN